MKILVVGSGGREHALAWKLAQSPKCTQVIVAPGNAGTQLEHKVTNINLVTVEELLDYALHNQIDFTVVGPEMPLALGIVDVFRAHNLLIWGPTKYCAQLESSKAFAKDFMVKYHIPTAKFATFDNSDNAINYLKQQPAPIVVKADGIAAGKGVLVAQTTLAAIDFVKQIFEDNVFGNAGSKVVIEEYLEGTEASFIVMVDGKNILAMATSQDHKRLLDGDNGPNTGGMGAYSPAPVIDDKLHQRIMDEIIRPTVEGMHNEGHAYTGFLYAGIMIDKNNNPSTLEFNCRFGDPETQPIMLRLDSDLVEIISQGLHQKLDMVKVKWHNYYAVGVVLASGSYPAAAKVNLPISGIEKISDVDIKIFHSSTIIKEQELCTAGGRVLCVVALGDTVEATRHKVYLAIDNIHFDGMQYRTDIACKALKFDIK
jgi:phosphoribosylamine--glycine ligase